MGLPHRLSPSCSHITLRVLPKNVCLFGGISWGKHINAYGSEGTKSCASFRLVRGVWGFLIASLQVVRTSPFVSCQKNRVSFRRDLLGQAHQRLWVGGDQKRRVLPVDERVWGFLIASLQVVRTSPFVSCFGKSVCCRGSACSSVGRGRKYSPRKTEQASLSRYVFSRVPDVVSSS